MPRSRGCLRSGRVKRLDGPGSPSRVSADAVAGDDAPAAAGHQAAAALYRRAGELRRGRARTQSPAGAARRSRCRPDRARRGAGRDVGAAEGDWASDELRTDRIAIENDIGTDLSNAFPDDAVTPPPSPLRQEGPTLPSLDGSRVSQGGGSDGDDRGLEDLVAGGLSLHDHLERQTLPLLDTAGDRAIALALIESIEDTGYLTEPVEDIATRLGTDPADVEGILAIIQQSEPIGVGARNLAECLALQLKDKDRYDPAMAALVDNLDLLARREFAQLRRICRVDEEDLADMVSEIRRLDPKPGLIFGGEPARVVVPDVFVRPAPDGSWTVELNGDALPRVIANRSYYARVSRTKDPAGRASSTRPGPPPTG